MRGSTRRPWGSRCSLGVFEFVLDTAGPVPVGGRQTIWAIGVAAMDAAVFTTLARFIIRPVASVGLSLLACVVGVALIFDATYYTASAPVVGRAVYEAVWALAYGAWAGAALHPDTPWLAARRIRSTWSFQADGRSAMTSIVIHSAGFVATMLLLWHHFSAAGAAPGVFVGAFLLQVLLVGTRSVRIISRMELDDVRRREAETALRASEERFRRLAEVAPVGIFVSDVEGRSIFQNDAWGRTAGIPAAEGLDLGYAERIHPEDRGRIMELWLNAVRTREPVSFDHRLLRPDGSVAWVRADAVPLDDADGRPAGWIGTVTDVTRLELARQAAQTREAFVGALVEQSPVGIGVYDPGGRMIVMNQALRRIREMAGIGPEAPDDVRGDPLMLRLDQGVAIERALAGEDGRTDPGTVSIPVAIRPGDAAPPDETGDRLWLRIRWFTLRDAEARMLAVISFTEDVTEAVRADAGRRRVEAKLQESAKLEALGVLAGGIAHDFNNLLVAILGYIEFARAGVPPASAVAQDLGAAMIAANRAADLARQMLAYSGRANLSVGPVSLEALLREMGDLVASSIAKGAQLRFEFAPDLPPVLADATQLRQLALNLIVNASDALEGERGTITLRTSLASLGPDDPTVVPGTTATPGGYVQLEVSDTGKGMDAATMARIFDPFFSTKSVGRGLGLAATLGIVKGHAGAIRVTSEPGSGTTFAVLLPPTTVEALPARPLGTAATANKGGRLLLVDDEPSVRLIARRILERAGFDVVEAGDGPEAIELFRADPDDVAGVVLDLTLPTVDGMTVMRELRRLRPDVPIVLCSGWSADEVASSISALPATTFLQKPFQVQAMLDAIASVVRLPGGD